MQPYEMRLSSGAGDASRSARYSCHGVVYVLPEARPVQALFGRPIEITAKL